MTLSNLILQLAQFLVGELHHLGAHHAHIVFRRHHGHIENLWVATRHLVIRFTLR